MFAWKICTVGVATALLAATAARADDAPSTIVVGSAKVVPVETPAGATPLTLTGTLTGSGSAERSPYWLGLFASRLSPALQSQLNLPKDQGLLVEDLQPEAPAAKAGVRQYDILLKGNDKVLADLHDLLQLIDQVKDGKLTLELLRAGKHETVTVSPQKRPAREPDRMLEEFFGSLSPEARSNMDGGPLEFRVVRPGQILPPGGPLPSPPGVGTAHLDVEIHTKTALADGSTVEIHRQGAEPAKVVVTHDKDKWEGTAADLSKVPEKIRPEVEKLLHPAFDHLSSAFAIPGSPVGGNVAYFAGPLSASSMSALAVSPAVEKRLSEMQKEIDELRRAVEELKKAK